MIVTDLNTRERARFIKLFEGQQDMTERVLDALRREDDEALAVAALILGLTSREPIVELLTVIKAATLTTVPNDASGLGDVKP